MKSTNFLRLFLLMSLMVTGLGLVAQQKQWVFLDDKGPEQAYWELHPEAYLSAKALQQHREVGHTQNVADLPVSATYRQQLADAGVKIHASSRWLNAFSVETQLSLKQLQAICPAVVGMQRVARFENSAYQGNGADAVTRQAQVDTISYGLTQFQIEQLNLDCLHERGFTGTGVLIAVFDAGFLNLDTISAFDSLWQQNRVLTYYDFVNHDTTIFDEHNHGMNVSSIIFGNLPGQMVGAAPHASLAMARTENVFSETHQEEDNWMQAVEWADSLGADVIQSSLGYTLFDPGEVDFTYADLDGNTTIITRAADMAAARGILVVNSAGNEGNAPWHHISAPCDADSILCVGAVDGFGSYVSFSGVGPSADGRVKPDVAALGLGTVIVGSDGSVGGGSGTSFSAPLMAGFAACLRQAHPLRNNMDIIRSIRQSGNQFGSPDTLLGYGIPNACKADSILSVMDSLELSVLAQSNNAPQVRVFPNPATDMLMLESRLARDRMKSLTVVAVDGRTVFHIDTVDPSQGLRTSIPLKPWAAGVYFVHIVLDNGQSQVTRFIKE